MRVGKRLVYFINGTTGNVCVLEPGQPGLGIFIQEYPFQQRDEFCLMSESSGISRKARVIVNAAGDIQSFTETLPEPFRVAFTIEFDPDYVGLETLTVSVDASSGVLRSVPKALPQADPPASRRV